jgi:hypothetical protein
MVIVLIILFINNKFDVVKTRAINSFNDLLVTGIEKAKEGPSWTITMPDKTSKLILQNNKEAVVTIVLDATPFLKAGLDIDKLPSYIKYDANKKELYYVSVYGKKVNNSVDIDSIFKNIVDTYRDKLGYHHKLEHFGLSLDNGNAFEYALDIDKNDKDIVIALNPETLIKAEVDPNKVEGFIYTDVTMDNGSTVKKLLKVFNVEEVNQCSLTSQNC